MEWIADWEKTDGGVLPIDLPYIYRSVRDSSEVVPEGVDTDFIDKLAAATGMRHLLLTRPMTFADSARADVRLLRRLWQECGYSGSARENTWQSFSAATTERTTVPSAAGIPPSQDSFFLLPDFSTASCSYPQLPFPLIWLWK